MASIINTLNRCVSFFSSFAHGGLLQSASLYGNNLSWLGVLLMMVALRRCYRISVALSSVASLSGFCGGVWDSLARQSEVEICLFSSRSWAIEGSPVCPEAVDKRCSSCVGGTVHRCR